MSWLIYKHTNKINRKCYIGQTKQTSSGRWRNGKGYNNYNKNTCSVFFNAIQKYGWDNFEHSILEENIQTLNQANEREIYWINFYRSYIGFDDCNGYNMTLGGDTGEHLGYRVYQISKEDLSIIDEFSSTAEASRKFGNKANDSVIRQCCEGKKVSFKESYWCYVKNYTKDWKPKKNELISPIYQLDNELNIVGRYDSITECIKFNPKFSAGSIISCCQRRQRKANKFIWCYESDYSTQWKPIEVKFNRNEKIYCFEKDTIYPSVKEASLETGANRSHIYRACKGLENGVKDLHFCYAKNKENYVLKKTQKRPNAFTEEETKLLKILYPKLGICDELLDKFPGRTKDGLGVKVNRLGLKYEGKKKTCRKVINIEKNKVFDSIKEAAKFAKLKTGSSIGQCCLGNKKRAAGDHWMYYDEYLRNGFTTK